MISNVKQAIQTKLTQATGVENFNYWGSTLAVRQKPQGVVWVSNVKPNGKKTMMTAKVAIALTAETPSDLEELIGSSVDAVFEEFGVLTGGTCVSTTLADGGTATMHFRLGANGISINDLEGFAENAQSSTLRYVKTSLAFILDVQVFGS